MFVIYQKEDVLSKEEYYASLGNVAYAATDYQNN
jgi:hypothetical protein